MTPTVLQVLHQGGGAGSVTSTLHLSLGLAKAGLHVRFACPPESEVESLARGGGLEVHPVVLHPHRRRSNAAALAALLERHPVELINSQSARDRDALTWLGLMGRLTVPLVITRRQMPRTFILENWLASRAADRVVAVSRSVGEALVRRGTPRRKLAVIPNGVITERLDVAVPHAALAEWKERIGWQPSQRTIGVVARQKDQHIVLRALDAIQTPVRLVLAGVGPESRLAKLAALAPERHAVVCLPFMPDVRPLYELLDVVLLPSRSEGLSQGLLEGMALGKPVVASDAPGNLDVVTDGVDGRLVPPLDPAMWAAAIEELLRNSALAHRLGEAGKHTARETYSLEHTIERTVSLYDTLLTQSSEPTARIPGARQW